MSLRELCWGIRAKGKWDWDQTSQVLAFIAAHGGAKNVEPDKLNPFRKDAGEPRSAKWGHYFDAMKSIRDANRKRRGQEGADDGSR